MDKKVFAQKSHHQLIELFENLEDKHLTLTLNRFVQFEEGVNEQVYHEALIRPIEENMPMVRKVVLLGAGDGLVARELLKLNPDLDITLVEIDNEIIRLCRSHPELKRLNQGALDRVKIIIADAKKWVLKQKNKFDAVIADFPDPHTEKLKELYSQSFLGNIKAVLKKSGIFVIQASNTWINTYFNTEQVFKKAYIINYVMPTMGEAKIVWSING